MESVAEGEPEVGQETCGEEWETGMRALTTESPSTHEVESYGKANRITSETKCDEYGGIQSQDMGTRGETMVVVTTWHVPKPQSHINVRVGLECPLGTL